MLLIIGQSVTEAAHDKQQLEPMAEAIEQQSGQWSRGHVASQSAAYGLH